MGFTILFQPHSGFHLYDICFIIQLVYGNVPFSQQVMSDHFHITKEFNEK